MQIYHSNLWVRSDKNYPKQCILDLCNCQLNVPKNCIVLFKIKKNYFLFLLFSCALLTSVAQQIDFIHLDVENGLAQNSVLAIGQDYKGFIWLGSSNGLNRYDSRNVKIYQPKYNDTTSISYNYILCLFSDSHNTLWVGTARGLNKYDFEKDCFTRIKDKSNDVTNGIINCISEDRKGNLLVGTSKGLYVLTDRNNNIFKPFSERLAKENIRAIYGDMDNNIWIGSNDGLTKISLEKNSIRYTKFLHNNNIVNSLSGNYVTTITEDKMRRIWIGTLHEGINLFDKKTQTFTHFNRTTSGLINDNIRKIICSKDGNLWIGTQEGLSILNMPVFKFTSYKHETENTKSLSQNSIYSIFADKDNSIWVGTFFGGVNFVSSISTAFKVYKKEDVGSNVSNNVISSIVEDNQKNLWIGTEGGGLTFLNRHSNTVINYKNQPSNNSSLGSNLVKVVYKDEDGNIWAGTHGGGLNLFNHLTKQFKRYFYDDKNAATEILALVEDNNKRLWVAQQYALKIYIKKNDELSEYKDSSISNALARKNIRKLFKDSENKIWIATDDGLFWYNQKESKIVRIKDPANELLHINVIFEDNNKQLWFGKEVGGLSMYNPVSGSIINYARKDGLVNTRILGILQDENKNLWLSTANGLSKFNPFTKFFRNYNISDGLPGNVFNYNSYLKTANNELFFGGYNGLISFYPNLIEENNIVPNFVFTSLKLFNKTIDGNTIDDPLVQDISFTKNIELKFNQNVITVDFASLNFIKPQKNQYAFILEGFNNEWNYTSVPSATFTKLSPGNYVLKAKGSNNDGIWSEPAIIKIKVLPPFWKTWWAYSIYTFLGIALIIFIIRFFFLRALLKRDMEFTQIKLNFFTNISHEIKTHLSLIIGPVENLMMDSKPDIEKDEQLNIIKKNSDSLLQLVNELMDFRKAETGNLKLHIGRWNIVSFVESISCSFHDLSVKKNIVTEFITTSNIIEVYFDKEQLEKVFYNLLANAYKFTPDHGKISIVIEEKKSLVEIKIIDNGKGIAPKNLKNLFENYYQENENNHQNTGYGIGLALSKSIIELHKGVITVYSEKISDNEQRTCFTTSFLFGKDHFDTLDIQTELSAQNLTQLEEKKSREVILSDVGRLNKQNKTKYSILLVEDNRDIRNFINSSLYSLYTIIEAENGEEAFEKAINCIPDIIISDVMMPVMDGLAFSYKIKTDDRTSHIPIILLTAKSSIANQISGLETGADIYITKPFSVQVLILHIHNLLLTRKKLAHQLTKQLSFLSAKINTENVSQNVGIDNGDLSLAVNSSNRNFLNDIIGQIEENIDNSDLNVNMISKKVAMSVSVLYKKLFALTGLTVNDFIKTIRLKKAASLLEQQEYTIYEVSFMVGFNDRKYFSKEFKKQFNITPTEFAKKMNAKPKS